MRSCCSKTCQFGLWPYFCRSRQNPTNKEGECEENLTCHINIAEGNRNDVPILGNRAIIKGVGNSVKGYANLVIGNSYRKVWDQVACQRNGFVPCSFAIDLNIRGAIKISIRHHLGQVVDKTVLKHDGRLVLVEIHGDKVEVVDFEVDNKYLTTSYQPMCIIFGCLYSSAGGIFNGSQLYFYRAESEDVMHDCKGHRCSVYVCLENHHGRLKDSQAEKGYGKAAVEHNFTMDIGDGGLNAWYFLVLFFMALTVGFLLQFLVRHLEISKRMEDIMSFLAWICILWVMTLVLKNVARPDPAENQELNHWVEVDGNQLTRKIDPVELLSFGYHRLGDCNFVSCDEEKAGSNPRVKVRCPATCSEGHTKRYPELFGTKGELVTVPPKFRQVC